LNQSRVLLAEVSFLRDSGRFIAEPGEVIRDRCDDRLLVDLDFDRNRRRKLGCDGAAS